MIDHIGIEVSDYKKSLEFYKNALAPLGYVLLIEVEGFAGFGPKDSPDPIANFWIHEGTEQSRKAHIAFNALIEKSSIAFIRQPCKQVAGTMGTLKYEKFIIRIITALLCSTRMDTILRRFVTTQKKRLGKIKNFHSSQGFFESKSALVIPYQLFQQIQALVNNFIPRATKSDPPMYLIQVTKRLFLMVCFSRPTEME